MGHTQLLHPGDNLFMLRVAICVARFGATASRSHESLSLGYQNPDLPYNHKKKKCERYDHPCL